MLETIREYALEQLALENELPDARARRMACLAALGERANPHLNGGAEYTELLRRLALEEDNLRAALRWCLDTRDARHRPACGGLCVVKIGYAQRWRLIER
jgi:predicted ATPase